MRYLHLTLLLSYVVPVKSKVEISQNFVAFSEYMNFTNIVGHPGVNVDPKSPAGSLVAVPIIETQIGMKRTLATTANIHHLPEQPFPTTATADAYPDPGRPSCDKFFFAKVEIV